MQGADDRLGRVPSGRQHDRSFVSWLEMGDVCLVSARCIDGDLEMRVDGAGWSDETRCWWKWKSVGRAGVGRAEGRQRKTRDLLALATKTSDRRRGHDDGPRYNAI